jgi:cell division protein DivIC
VLIVAKKKKTKSLKTGIRILMAFVLFGIVTTALAYNCLSNLSKIRDLRNEKENLEDKLLVLKEERILLETDILRLKDPEYIAKYVREKYFYSKDGELILRLD